LVAERHRRELARDGFEAATVDRTVAAALGLVGLMVVAIVARVLIGRNIVTPWIMTDELIYSELAKSFAEQGKLLAREQPTVLFSLYPILIAPAWLADGVANAYGIAKAINALLMTLAVVPLYLWARRLVAPGYALLAAALTLLMPSFLYTGTLMTENAALPAFVLAFFALASALERPSILNQLLVLAAIGLAAAVRVQGVALAGVLLVALALFAVLEGRAAGKVFSVADVRRFWPALLSLLALGGGYLAYKTAQGESIESGLGAYEPAGAADYQLRETARWVVWHLGELSFSVGLVPVCALLVLVWLGLRGGNDLTRAERAFLAVTLASIAVIGVQVALFASRFSLRIEERNLFYVAPLLLLALVVWLARGLPRPPVAVAVAVGVPLALVAALPLGRFLNISILSDTLGLISLFRLNRPFDIDTVKTLLVLGTAAAGLAFAFLPRRFAVAILPAGVGLFLALSTYPAYGAIRDLSVGERLLPGPGDASWIDDTAKGRDVAYVYGSSSDGALEAKVMWQTEFWNESVGEVIGRQPEPSGLENTPATVDSATGELVTASGPIDLPLAVTDASVELAGRPLVRHGRLALYRVEPPLRVAAATEGVYGDRWTGPFAAYTRFASAGDAPGRLRVRLSRAGWGGKDVPGNVGVRVGPVGLKGGQAQILRVTAKRDWVAHSGTSRTFTLPTPPPPFRLEIRVDPTFSPSTFGLGDTRQLGVQASLRFLPQRR
jgi:Dolichyl-phosphate-mannose-protein mannosyltransferase